MCGIAGILPLSSGKAVTPGELGPMIDAVSHRGPDGTGMYLDDHAGLAHSRLSIIDLSTGGQPIANEAGTLWIVFNGEIFNYPELRQALIGRGHVFATATDTEVILHLYEDEGPSCLDRMNGQFAFAIWDARKRELFLARDRVGILPLHYTFSGGRFLFASEIKSLFAVPGVPRHLDPIALDQIFTFWTTLPGRTAFLGISELPAGHYLTVVNGLVNVQRYWEVPGPDADRYPFRSREEAAGELKSLIRDAVRVRLRADVPVGSYVSGGLDSTGITAIARHYVAGRIKTFGIGFTDRTFDESEHQRYLAGTLGTDHAGLVVGDRQIGASFQDVVWHCEKPLLRTAPVPLFLLSDAVRAAGCKVVLTGEGADEIFGGYDIFKEAKVLRFWSRQPDSVSRPRLLDRVYPQLFGKGRSGKFAHAFFGSRLDAVHDPLFSHLVRWHTTSRTKIFFSEELCRAIGPYDCLEDLRRMLPPGFSQRHWLSRAQHLETTIFLSNYLLSSQGDRVAMAHGVEIRPPYLDHRIIEFMSRVPAQWKISGLQEKYLLKRALRDIVPERILQRRKQPYRAPIRQSLLQSHEALYDRVTERALVKTGLFDPGKVGKLLNKMHSGQSDNETDNMAIAGILSSQIIHSLYIDRQPAALAAASFPGLVIDRRNGGADRPAASGQRHVYAESHSRVSRLRR